MFKIYNVNAFTVKLTSYKIRLTSDCANKVNIKNHVILANITIIITCNTACSSVFLRVNRWCNHFFHFFFLLEIVLKQSLGSKVLSASSLCRIEKRFLITPSILGNIGLY